MSTLLIVLLGLGMAAMQLLIGGVKMVYSLPAYTVLGFAGILTLGWLRRPVGAKPIVWCLAAAALLAGYIGWRAAVSPVGYLARTDFFVILGAFLTYLVTAVHLVNPRHRLIVMWVLFGLVLAHVATGVVQFKEKQNFMLLPWILRSDYDYRASGFYICPNHLAGLLEMTGLLALALAIWGRGKTWTRILFGYIAVMALTGIAITGSRGGYLSTVAGIVAFGVLTLFVVWRVKKRWFWRAVLLAVFGCAGLVGTTVWAMKMSADLDRRLGEIHDPKNMRLLMWKAALDAHKIAPWTGTGAGTYLYYGRHFRSEEVQADPQHVHNDYLELLTEYGYVGCGVMALFLITHAASGFTAVGGIIRSRLKPFGLARSNELAVVLGILSGFAAIAVHSVVDFNLHIPANAVLAAFLFGILANPRTLRPDEQPRWRIDAVPIRIAPVLVGASLITLAVPKIVPEYFAERARMALRDRMPNEAIDFAQRAIAQDAANPNLYYYLGESKHILALAETNAAARRKLHTEAASAFAEGLKQFSGDLNLLLKLARTLDNLQRYAEADFTYRLAIQADPNLGTVYALYGHHYFIQRRMIRAEKLYAKAYLLGERDISPTGLEDIALYRVRAASGELGEQFPLEDLPGDENWEPGEP